MSSSDIRQDVQEIIFDANRSKRVFWKFLSPNDTGKTGGHQYGVLVSISARQIMFDDDVSQFTSPEKRNISIYWPQLAQFTESCFTYYPSKKELRITRFQKGFPYFSNEKYTGSLFVLTEKDRNNYHGYVLSDDEDIDSFLSYFNLNPENQNHLLFSQKSYETFENLVNVARKFFESHDEFPTSKEMAKETWNYARLYCSEEVNPINDPDETLILWTDIEYKLFKEFENEDAKRAGVLDALKDKEVHIQDLVDIANSILNRRKSRAGKSLENHLEELFKENGLKFTSQGRTEENKRPDFLFPSEVAYHDSSFPSEKLFSLAAKTTCKDRWRQVVTESDRIVTKYLCTLQQGISRNQLDEMKADNVVLVVPQKNLSKFPSDRQDLLMTIKDFIRMIKESQK